MAEKACVKRLQKEYRALCKVWSHFNTVVFRASKYILLNSMLKFSFGIPIPFSFSLKLHISFLEYTFRYFLLRLLFINQFSPSMMCAWKDNYIFFCWFAVYFMLKLMVSVRTSILLPCQKFPELKFLWYCSLPCIIRQIQWWQLYGCRNCASLLYTMRSSFAIMLKIII